MAAGNMDESSPLSLSTALQTQLQPGDGWNRQDHSSVLFMGAESTLTVTRHYMMRESKKNKKISDLEMNFKLVTVQLKVGSDRCL